MLTFTLSIFAAVNEIYIYVIIAFAGGFLLAWLFRTYTMQKVLKEYKSAQGFLESEKRIKETLQKENKSVYQQKQNVETAMSDRLKQAQNIIRRMDEDILLLQKSNEETEELLRQSNPELSELKLKLLEAQNTISRYKSRLGEK